MSVGKPEYQQLIKTIQDEYAKISNFGYDIGDFGNAVGYALGEELKDEEAAWDFIWGVDHGVSLIDGSHDNHSLRDWIFGVRDRDNSWWRFTLKKIKFRLGIYD